MTQKPISRKKLTEFLTNAKIDTTGLPADGHYLYSTGRNILADLTIVGLATGRFDED